MGVRRMGWMGSAGLAVCVMLGVLAERGVCQQAGDDFTGSIGMISTTTAPDANGKRVTQVTLSGTLGEVSFSLNEKEAAAVLGDGMNMDMAALTKMYVTKSQESLGTTPEEWKVLGPKINKVQRLRMALRSQGRAGATEGASAELRKAWVELSGLLKKKDVTAEEVKPVLEKVNEAEAKVKKELEEAQKDLKELLTLKQEAMMVQHGILD